ncbi:MAG TPA: GTP-dependent dephospho-CoA kinase family protein [Candidatus Thermoplasmatota archaeon]|nr:GTP-dependent dephospho-CoA kinase family protein [Candidatus Thermoplasmatota archaeon]
MYHVPHALRADLARPMGPVLTTEEALPRLTGGARVITVGDVVTRTLLEAGLTPQVAVVDYRTKRAEDAEMAALVADRKLPQIEVDNPPGVITADLWEALVSALHARVPVVVRVEGEEDLAVLPLLAMAPAGTLVVYGQPPVTDLGITKGGMVIVEVTPAARSHAHHILHRMEVR